MPAPRPTGPTRDVRLAALFALACSGVVLTAVGVLLDTGLARDAGGMVRDLVFASTTATVALFTLPVR